MNTIQLDSFAKINLSLDVLEEREDGYHNIDTIMQLIDLKDVIEIECIDQNECIIECNKQNIPLDHTNLVHKAWEALKKYTGIQQGIKVHIQKNIPVAAGLAGGSSNAAAVIKGLNEILGLNLSKEEMMEIGIGIGADVPYFFMGKTARATGVGNIFEEISPLKTEGVLIVNNGREISSKEVYEDIETSEKSKIGKVVSAIENQDLNALRESAYNTMERVVFEKYPKIQEIKNRLLSLGADVVLMSGSGATVFAITNTLEKRNGIYEELKEDYPIVFKAKTI